MSGVGRQEVRIWAGRSDELATDGQFPSVALRVSDIGTHAIPLPASDRRNRCRTGGNSTVVHRMKLGLGPDVDGERHSVPPDLRGRRIGRSLIPKQANGVER